MNHVVKTLIILKKLGNVIAIARRSLRCYLSDVSQVVILYNITDKTQPLVSRDQLSAQAYTSAALMRELIHAVVSFNLRVMHIVLQVHQTCMGVL